MSSTVEKIKERLDITDIVGSYLKLEKTGANFKACCPFHNEKTASFFVSPSRQTYHCFGCDKGGDMFNFLQEIEGVDFPGALKVLADKAGVEIEKTNRTEISEKEKLFSVIEAATQFFQRNLKGQKEVIEYLKKRGLTGETAKKFRIGCVSNEWRSLFDYLKKEGFSDTVIEKAGLIINGEKGYYDRFRGRIIFPITDNFGRVAGFSGRVFGADGDNTAKYINSPETVLYNKSKILYGFDKAKVSIRKRNMCVLVEGQMDLLMSHQVGLVNTVAVSGTALTQDHLNLIKRLTDNLVIAFDPDSAGVDASRRGVDIALSIGVDVKVVRLPHGLDPADLILKDKQKWINLVENAEHIIDFYLGSLADQDLPQREFRIKVGEIVLPYVSKLKNKINQAHFVSEIARKLGISEDPIWEELRNLPVENLKRQNDISALEKERTSSTFSRKEMIERKILGVLFWQEEIENRTIDVNKFKETYKEAVNEQDFKKIEDRIGDKKKEFIFEAEMYYGNIQGLEKELDELVKYLKEETLKEEFTHTMDALRIAENKGDIKAAADFLKKCQEISKKLTS